ncbi:MAG: hypothetical protein KatS3mg090_0135 [Patescibacteria group bacterium]|nr:MAG: hypothetical protein KatS3mg090_0135 [Patescibacteria group bacterium]
MINQQILNLTERLIKIGSVNKSLKELKEVIEEAKKDLSDFQIEVFSKDNIPSLLAYNSSKRPRDLRLFSMLIWMLFRESLSSLIQR